MEYIIEKMNDEFVKYVLSFGEGQFTPAIHHFTNPSRHGQDVHDHPFDFTTYIIKGSYVERVYTPNEDGTYSYEDVHRKEGTCAHIKAEHIHSIIALPEGECYTLVVNSPWRRQWRHWEFNEYGYNWWEAEK